MREDGQVKVFGFDHPDMERIALPVGMTCHYCEEMIIPTDEGFSLIGVCPLPECSLGSQAHRVYEHRACFLRGILGSVAHIEKRCSCYVPGSHEGDDPGMTRRQAAEAAVSAWSTMHVELEHGPRPKAEANIQRTDC